MRVCQSHDPIWYNAFVDRGYGCLVLEKESIANVSRTVIDSVGVGASFCSFSPSIASVW